LLDGPRSHGEFWFGADSSIDLVSKQPLIERSSQVSD
jgi:hypothetical protein